MEKNLPRIENIIDELGDGITILDGGAGRGSFKYIEFPGARIVALDVQPFENPDDPPNVERVVGDLEKLPFGDDVFDFVALNFVLEHILKPVEVLSEIDRVLKPGGIFYFSIPDSSAPEDRLFRFAYKITHPASLFKPFPGAHNQTFTLDSIRALLSKSGFGIASIAKYPGGFTWMPFKLRMAFLDTCRKLDNDPTRKGNWIIRAERGTGEEQVFIFDYVCFNCGIPTRTVNVEDGRWKCPACDGSNIHFPPKS